MVVGEDFAIEAVDRVDVARHACGLRSACLNSMSPWL